MDSFFNAGDCNQITTAIQFTQNTTMSFIRFTTRALNGHNVVPVPGFSMSKHELGRPFDLPVVDGDMGSAGDWSPALDLHQNGETVFVKIELPGMKKEDVTLSLHDGLLTLTGARTQEKDDADMTVLRNERFFGRFERTVTLPVQVDATRVSAVYEDGVLTVILPKAESAKPRQIEIGLK